MSEHPFQVMPDLTGEEYEALRTDIATNGVLVPVVKDLEGNVIDGHHRIEIAHELGVDFQVNRVAVESGEHARGLARQYNLARRHLSRLQKRQLIGEEIEADPSRSDREIARVMACDHKTVASVRRELTGEVPQPPPLVLVTREDAERISAHILQGAREMDKQILLGLLKGVPPAQLASALTARWRTFEAEHSGDEELLAPIRQSYYQRLEAILAFPHSGYYAEEGRAVLHEMSGAGA